MFTSAPEGGGSSYQQQNHPVIVIQIYSFLPETETRQKTTELKSKPAKQNPVKAGLMGNFYLSLTQGSSIG